MAFFFLFSIFLTLIYVLYTSVTNFSETGDETKGKVCERKTVTHKRQVGSRCRKTSRERAGTRGREDKLAGRGEDSQIIAPLRLNMEGTGTMLGAVSVDGGTDAGGTSLRGEAGSRTDQHHTGMKSRKSQKIKVLNCDQ